MLEQLAQLPAVLAGERPERLLVLLLVRGPSEVDDGGRVGRGDDRALQQLGPVAALDTVRPVGVVVVRDPRGRPERDRGPSLGTGCAWGERRGTRVVGRGREQPGDVVLHRRVVRGGGGLGAAQHQHCGARQHRERPPARRRRGPPGGHGAGQVGRSGRRARALGMPCRQAVGDVGEQRLGDVPRGEPREAGRDHEDAGGRERAHPLRSRGQEPEDQDRPVPEVQGVRHARAEAQRGAVQEALDAPSRWPGRSGCVRGPLRERPGGPDRALGGTRGRSRSGPGARRRRARDRRDQHERGTADGHQGPDAGEHAGAVDQEARPDDQGEPDPAEDVLPADVLPAERDSRAEGQGEQCARADLPEPRERAEVGDRLVHGDEPERVAERRGGGRARHHGDQATGRQEGPSGPNTALRDDNKAQHHQRPGGEELALHRQRPEVLQRARVRPRRPVRERGVHQLPVLPEGRGRPDLPQPRRPAHPGREREQGHRDGCQDHERRREQPGERARVVRGEPQGAALCAAQQRARREVPGQQEEHVHSTRDPAVAEQMERDHEGQGEPAEPVDGADAPGRVRAR